MDILAILDSKGISYSHKTQGEVAIHCPNQAAHSGAVDINASFDINLEKGVASCFACGFKLGPEAFIKWLVGGELDEMQVTCMGLRARLKRVPPPTLFLNEAEEFTMMPPSKPWTEDYRGIPAEFYQKIGARKCEVGRYADRMVLPIYINGRLKGFDSRALTSEMKPKYLRSKGFNSKEEGLYPYDLVLDMRPRIVILCEGIFDALNACSKGFPALCLFGLVMSLPKFALLVSIGVQEVVLMLDNDEAGNSAEAKLYEMMSPWIKVSFADKSLLVDGRDLGDLALEEIEYCVDNRRNKK